MAIEKHGPHAPSAAPQGGFGRRARWVHFGLNVVVQVLLAMILVVAAVWLPWAFLKGRVRSDWTASGRFSLSPRTKAMLKDLPCDVRLTNLYEHTPEIPESEEQWQRVQDLLAEYEMAAPKRVTVAAVNPAVDQAAVENLVVRLRQRYSEEFAKPKALLKKYEGLHKDLTTLLDTEAEKLDAAAKAWREGPADGVNALRMVAQRWHQFVMIGQIVTVAIQTMTDEKEGLPAYSTALTRAKDYTRQVSEMFAAVPDLYGQIQDFAKKGPLPEEVKTVLASAKTTYAPMQQRIADFEKEAMAPKESQLDAIRRDISRGEVVLVETYLPKGVIKISPEDALRVTLAVIPPKDKTAAIPPDDLKPRLAESKEPGKEAFEVLVPPELLDEHKAALAAQKVNVLSAEVAPRLDQIKVVSFDDIWVPNPRAQTREEAQERLFAGESAVSSTLLGLAQKEKPAVLFVTAGMPASSMGGPCGQMAERLRRANFIVEDWDLMRQPDMPKPENASKIILVLVPPAPPNPQMPMPPPSPEQYRAAIDAVKGGAPVVLMGEPASMFAPPPPYAELFRLFGVEGKWNAVAVRSVVVDNAGTEKAMPQVEITKYTDHPITQPLGALPSMFLTAAPLEIQKDLPAGVTAAVIVNLPASRDYWADTDIFTAMRGEAKRDDAEDLSGPLPLAVAATRKLENGVQKAVLFGDGNFAQDGVAFYRNPRDPFAGDLFPGNAELFINSLLWTAGTEKPITVSPEALLARRIGELGHDGRLEWPVRIGLIAGLPLIVLTSGIIVYFVRRRYK